MVGYSYNINILMVGILINSFWYSTSNMLDKTL